MTNTRDKLNEAIFCLNLMKEVLHGLNATTEPGRDNFRHALNLFLSSARSITWIMKSEFDKVPGLESWYSAQETQMRSDNTMRFLLEQRNISLKQRPIQPQGITKVSFTEYLTVSSSLSIVVTHADGTEEKSESRSEPSPLPKPTEVAIEQSWYFSELPEDSNEVVAICEAHITKLEQLVSECESKFTN